jgi:hypothetical protein
MRVIVTGHHVLSKWLVKDDGEREHLPFTDDEEAFIRPQTWAEAHGREGLAEARERGEASMKAYDKAYALPKDESTAEHKVEFSAGMIKTPDGWKPLREHKPTDFTMTHQTIEPIPAATDGAKRQAALNIVKAVGEAIRDCGPQGIPSGHLYAAVMDIVPLAGFQSIVTALKGAGMVKESNHLLVWIGPTE